MGVDVEVDLPSLAELEVGMEREVSVFGKEPHMLLQRPELPNADIEPGRARGVRLVVRRPKAGRVPCPGDSQASQERPEQPQLLDGLEVDGRMLDWNVTRPGAFQNLRSIDYKAWRS